MQCSVHKCLQSGSCTVRVRSRSVGLINNISQPEGYGVYTDYFFHIRVQLGMRLKYHQVIVWFRKTNKIPDSSSFDWKEVLLGGEMVFKA